MSFNQKYEHYVNELPKFMLDRIRKKILIKYSIDESNEYIDKIFEDTHNAYQKKREYDSAFYKKHQGKNREDIHKMKEEITRLEKENKEFRDHLTNFIEFHKNNNLPPIKKNKKVI